MRQAGGGRNPLQRLWLRHFASRRAAQGRVLFGGVLPAWRRRGIGRQLLNQALAAAHALGWNHLHVGPIPTAAAAVDFIQAHGAQAERTYRIFRWDAPTWF
jgi:GNAT superfamily N-acetyltransferase